MLDNDLPEIKTTTNQILPTKKSLWPLHYYATDSDLKDKNLWYGTPGSVHLSYPGNQLYIQFVPNEHQSKFSGNLRGGTMLHGGGNRYHLYFIIGMIILGGIIVVGMDIFKNKLAQEELPITFANPPTNPTIIDVKQIDCLAEVIFNEARNQSLLGQRAVATVVLNRSAITKKSICEVTNSKGQFAPKKQIKEQEAWNASYLIADYLIGEFHSGHFFDVTYGATYFHHVRVNPVWKTKMQYVTRIEDHIFYREKE